MIESLDLNTLTVLIPIITTIIGGIAAINEKIKNKNLIGALTDAKGLFDNVMNALSPLTDIDTVPDELKTGFNSAIFKTTEKERNKITSDLSVAESLSINTYIDAKETSGCNYYEINTTKGKYIIENGYIDDFFPTENITVKTVGGLTISSANIVNVLLEDIELYDNINISQKKYIGKTINVKFIGQSTGTLVVGAYVDGTLIGKNVFNTIESTIDYASFRLPQYKESDIGISMSIGKHTLEIKTGYVSGYSTYDGTVESSSDQVTWKTNELYNVIVNE